MKTLSREIFLIIERARSAATKQGISLVYKTMTITRKTITSGVLATALCLGSSAPAFAAPKDTPADYTSTQTNIISTDAIVKLISGINSNNYSAKVVVTNSQGTDIIDVYSITTLSSIFESNNLSISDYRSSNNTALEKDAILKSGEELLVFALEVSGTSEIVKLPAPETEKETDELFIGETKVEKEGKDGKAVKTVITIKELATDKKVNKDSKGEKEELKEEKLTVLIQPEEKVTLIGTKPEPVAVVAASRSAGTRAVPQTRSATRSAISTSAAANTPAPAKTAPPAAANGNAILEIASQYVGTPYVWGGTTPNGFDCSGFTSYVYRQIGINLPRSSSQQGNVGTVVSRANAQPGDLIWSPGHIAIYAGNNQMIDAPRPGKTVQYRTIWQPNPKFNRNE